MKRFIAALAFALAMLALPVLAVAGGGSVSDGSATGPTIDSGSALVMLNGEPLATYEKTKPPHGKKIDFSSSSVKSYRAQLSNLRNDFKRWLRQYAPAAKVTGEFDISLNAVGVQLNGASLGTIASAPMVQSAQYQGVYRPLGHEDPDLDLVSAFEAWTAGGGGNSAKGEGVKVAIVDTGIDVTHPCYSDAGYPSQQRLGTTSLTNNKVIVAKVFNNQSGSRGHTPADVNGHGTHVAGTVACNEHTSASVDGVPVTTAPGGYAPSGVAPRALLGNYNVFPGTDTNARSEDIVDALEEAYEDGFLIANMSLGGRSDGINDLLAMAVDNLDRANMVIAVAAGNSGPGFGTIESPGKAARALTAGASTVGHFIGTPVTVGALAVAAGAGDFATVTGAPLTAPLGVVTGGTAATGGLSTACSTVTTNLTGKIALVSRGVCTFSTKIRNAEAAGAFATLVVNNVAGDPVAMAQDGTANQPTKPAYMVSLADRTALMAADGASTTISPARAYLRTTNSDIRAGFSSEGPTDVDFRVKPDVMAPGVNVLSAQPADTCEPAHRPCWAFFQGTSMATPHLAGAAAVVRGQHMTWSAGEVRSAVVNTADQNVVRSHINGTTIVKDVNIVGAGRLNVFSAVMAKTALDPVSVSFGAVPSGSGQADSRTVAVKTLSGTGPYTVAVTGETGFGVDFGASISGNTILVTMTAAKGVPNGSRQGILRVMGPSGGEVAHAAVYVLIK